jgi:hypothetical protein
MSFSDRRYNMVAARLHEWVAELDRRGEADKVLYRTSGPSGGTEQAVTPRMILTEVEKHTPLGESLVENWLDMAVNHIVKAPF